MVVNRCLNSSSKDLQIRDRPGVVRLHFHDPSELRAVDAKRGSLTGSRVLCFRSAAGDKSRYSVIVAVR